MNYSSLFRTIDPRYPTNLAILFLSTLTGGIWFIMSFYQGDTFLDSLIAAILMGISVILTWAIGREIDPEHEMAAFAGLVVVVPGYRLLGAPNLLAVITLLMVLRLINRSTGGIPKIIDSLTLTGFGGWLSLRVDWIFGLLTAAGLFLDSRLPIPKRQDLFFSGIMAVATISMIFITGVDLPQISISFPESMVVLVVILLFTPLIIDSRDIELFCDLPGETFIPVRLQVCPIFAIAAVILVWLLIGGSAFSELLPIWSSIIAVSVVFLVKSFFTFVGERSKRS